MTVRALALLETLPVQLASGLCSALGRTPGCTVAYHPPRP